MDRTELDIEGIRAEPRAKPRRAALDALERLLRAHQALSEQRSPESPYGLLRPARTDELDLIEAVFRHRGVPLPDTLRAIYRRTLGVGNPLSSVPVLAVPFLRAALPDEGYGSPVVGLAAFEEDLGLYWDEAALERPPFLHLGHAAPLGLTVSRNGLWSLRDYRGRRDPPQPQDFAIVFEGAFCILVDQVILLWANDLAGGLMGPSDLDLTRGARPAAMPLAVQEARAYLLAPRASGSRAWGEIQPLDNADLLHAWTRSEALASAPFASHVAVVGLPYGDHPDAASRIGPGTPLRLRPVDDNPHDPNAVEVWHDGEISVRVGFVARQEAPMVRALPQGASAWGLVTMGRSDHALYATLKRQAPDDGILPGRDGASMDGLSSGGERLDLFSRRP